MAKFWIEKCKVPGGSWKRVQGMHNFVVRVEPGTIIVCVKESKGHEKYSIPIVSIFTFWGFTYMYNDYKYN